MAAKRAMRARLGQRRRRAWLWRAAAALAITVALAGGLAALSRLPALAIESVKILGVVVLDEAEVKTAAVGALGGNWAGLFSKNNFLIYPRKHLQKDLTERFKRIESVSLEMGEENILTVEIRERQGKYLWCGADPTSPEECFFADSKGYIFDRAPYFSGNAYFKIFSGLSGSYILPSDEFARLMEFRRHLENLQLDPVYFWLKGDEQCAARGALGFEIFFLCGGEPDKLAGDLSAALRAEPFLPDYMEKIPKLLYLDLRHDNKVFYKFK